MKKNFSIYLNTFIFIIFSLFYIPAQAAETYILDPNHTYVLWQINHFNFSTQVGKWYATGTLILDKDNPQNSKLTTTIKLANIVTGIPELDDHLKGKLFFDVAQFPTATFTSKKIEITGKDTAKVSGDLNLHGVTKPITLDVKLTQSGINPITNKMTAGFAATATIKRSDFGINTLIPGLSDEVKLEIGSEASPK